ncbi:MAG: putative peptidoglycan glycosyltransferase FtsW [Victivallaceae bacterium]|nr:putative peptidoglycan glycosyltransferase FtsW [Victivallaceae bacterium]
MNEPAMSGVRQNDQTRADAIIDPALESRMTAGACGLVVTTAALLLFGLTMLYSASFQSDGAHYFYSQLVWMGISMAAGVGVFLLGYRLLAEYSPLLLFVIASLLLVAVLCYPPTNGAYRWIKLEFGGLKISIQPSEFVKVVIPLYVGKYCADNFRHISAMFSRSGALIPIGVTGVMCALVMLGHDLGTTLLIFTVTMLTLFVAGLKVRYYVFPVLLGVGIFFLILYFDPMRLARITSFLDPEGLSDTTGYQLWSSLLALGSGSWTGVGFMEGRFKAQYLPEKHTDFILAVIGEELGYVALVAVIVAYLLFLYFALRISCGARGRQGMFTGVGLSMTIAIQALINIGVVSGALPTKGIPAPLLSYGGSSLLMCGMAVGLLLNIAADAVTPNFNSEMWKRIFKRK